MFKVNKYFKLFIIINDLVFIIFDFILVNHRKLLLINYIMFSIKIYEISVNKLKYV